jgi:hypothetical protein
MTYYTVYKITNKMNGKIYIGSHKTCNLNDEYMGSGKYLKRAIEKHGIDNFVKEILFVFDTPELMYAKEAELVDEEFLAEANTYNLKVGGFGGWDYVNANPIPTEDRVKFSKLGGLTRHLLSKEIKIRIVNGIAKSEIRLNGNTKARELYPKSGFYGKQHSDVTKERIGVANAVSSKGKRNSQFGTMWVTNEVESMKIKKTDDIPEGYRKGRKLN